MKTHKVPEEKQQKMPKNAKKKKKKKKHKITFFILNSPRQLLI